jgi:hypothetical protein
MSLYTRSYPLDTKIQFILTEPITIDDHSLITDPNVTIMAKVHLINYNSTKPPDYSNYTVYPETYAVGNAQNIGKRLADWFEYQGLIKGSGQAYGGLYGGSICIDGFGESLYNSSSIFYTEQDLVGEFVAGFHAQSSSRAEEILVSNPFDPLSLGDFINVALAQMKEECDNRNLCYPLYFSNNFKEIISGTNQIGLNTSNGASYKGFLDGLASERSSSETIFEEWNGSTWSGLTLQDAYDLAGSPTYNSSEFWNKEPNRTWIIKMQPFYNRINDHALYKVIYEPAKEIFPNILCGNCNISHGISSTQTSQTWDAYLNWLRYPYLTLTDNRFLRADYNSPSCYCPNMDFKVPFSYHPIQNVESPAPEGLGHIFGLTKSDIYRNYAIQKVASSLTSKPLPSIPWIEAPNESISIFEEIYVPTTDDILYVLQQQYLLGVRTWHVSNPTFVGKNTTSINQCNNFATMIDAFRTWINSQPRTCRKRFLS